MNFSLENIRPNVRALAEKLSAKSFIRKFYLAGGTAIALFFNHRRSDDLDFFSEKMFKGVALINNLKKTGKFETLKTDENTLIGKLNGVKSLAYFNDAEYDEMPEMYIDIKWREVKNFFLKQKLVLAKKFFGI